MKLRFRPFQSKETLKLEVPNSSTLPQLRQILSESLPNSPSPASIRLSLNRKDDIQSDGADTLQSLGIAPGDLVYFSVENAEAATTASDPPISQATASTSTVPDQSDSAMLDSQKRKTLGTEMEDESASNMEEVDVDSIENNRIGDELFEVVEDKSFFVPGFLRKVFAAELGGNDAGRDHKLIVIAVHAVMLESGFVGFDERENAVIDGFQLRNEWPSGLFRVSLFYTLRESVGGSGDGGGEAIKRVVLKFQSLGNYLSVYGTLGDGSVKRGRHFGVRLNEDELVPFLNVVWANCGVMDNVGGRNEEPSSTSPEKEVFRFWRTVKDDLALPLLIDLCEEAGLELPPCFVRLPTELKLKILESLPGVDVAKASCVCSELRYLGSSDDLWKAKFGEEFAAETKDAQVSWKKAFSMAWSRRNGRRLASRVRASPYWPVPDWPQPPRRRRYPNPLTLQRVPRFLGDGDGDDLHYPMRRFSPECGFGVGGGRFV